MPATLRQLTLIALLGSALAGCGKPEPAAKADAAAAKPAATLLLAPVDLRELRASQQSSGPVISGSLQPERRADLRAEIGAVVLRVLKENGEPVRSGELLVQLDATAIRDSLSSAEESVRAVSQAFDQAERQLQRLKTLQAQGMSSMQALEDAEVRRNNAQSDLVAARARVVSASQQMRRTEVRAPFDGVISERRVSAGDNVQVGRELVKVIDPGSLRFEGLVTADRMSELKIGQRVIFRVNGFPHGDLFGVVRRIDAAANATTRQVEVVVAFAEPAKAPRVAGLFAEGRVETGGAQVLMLPEGALVRAGEAAHAWRVEGRNLRKVSVKLGERDPRSGEYPVLAGLNEGDRVLRNPGSALIDGQAVEFAAAPAASGAASAEAAASAAASAAR